MALIDGRAALGSLNRAEVGRGRRIFEDLIAKDDGNPTHHVGLANACVLQYEATRGEASPDRDALERAVCHAREAVRRAPNLAEARITLGFVLDRAGQRLEALASLQRGLDLEPDNWRHQIRAAAVMWGDDRLRAARRALELWPALALAHFLAASVFVARDALALAEREIDLALAAIADSATPTLRFSSVAVWWLKGLLCLARGATDEALAAFERELAQEALGHIYSRECAAQVWYAKGVCAHRRGDTSAARAAFGEALARVPRLPMAHAALAIVEGRTSPFTWPGPGPAPIEVVLAQAALLKAGGHEADAAALGARSLEEAPAGNGGWLLPIDPLLSVQAHKDVWTPALMTLRARAGTWTRPDPRC